MIKNSGIIFLLFDWLFLLCLISNEDKKETQKKNFNKNKKKNKSKGNNFIGMLSNSRTSRFTIVSAGYYYWGSMIAGWILWKLHIAAVFDNAAYGRHSMSLAYIKMVLSQRSPEDFKVLISSFLRNWFSLNNESREWHVCIMFMIVVILTVIKEKGIGSIKKFVLTFFLSKNN